MYGDDSYKFDSLTQFTLFTSKVVLDEILEDLKSKGVNVKIGSWSRGWGGSASGIDIKIISDVPLL
jgi:hypothetical protein